MSYSLIRLDAGHDTNGNPRRVFVVLDKDSDVLAAVDEGYAGSHALEEWIPGALGSRLRRANYPTFATTGAEYRGLLRDYGPRGVIRRQRGYLKFKGEVGTGGAFRDAPSVDEVMAFAGERNQRVVHVHLGSATHPPMSTLRVTSREELGQLVRDAKANGEPLRCQIGGKTVSTMKALGHLEGR